MPQREAARAQPRRARAALRRQRLARAVRCPPRGAAQAQLNVRFSALSWVEISDADGRRLLHGLYAPGSTREVSGTAPLRVVLGNAPAVDLQLNGQPVTIAGLVQRNGSALSAHRRQRACERGGSAPGARRLRWRSRSSPCAE